MKNFLTNKINLLIILLLAVLLGGTCYLSYNTFFKHDIIAIDFTKLEKDEIVSWASKEVLKEEDLKFSDQYSETIEIGKPISQKPAIGEKIDGTLVIVLSKGPDPELKVTLPTIEEYTTKQVLEEWFLKNHFTDITYEYVLDKANKDTVLKISQDGEVARNTPIVVTLSAGDDKNSVQITIPDFTKYSKSGIEAWSSSNSVTIKFSYISSVTEYNKVLSQSKSAGTIISPGTSIEVVLSGGKAIELDDLSHKSEAEINKYIKDNDLKVKYIKQSSETVKEGLAISQRPSKGENVFRGQTITIYLSSGNDDKVFVDDKRLGYSEKDFIAYITSLGLKANKKDTAFYSTTIKEGAIYSYDDGYLKKGETVNYSLSIGAYVVDLTQFENKSLNDANKYVTKISDMNGHLVLKKTEVKNNDKVGLLYDCNSSKSGYTTTVSCKLGIKDGNTSSEKVVVADNKLGISEKDFISYIESLGLKAKKSSITYYSKTLKNGTVYSYDDGSFNKGDTINYALSIGEFKADLSRFNNKNLDEANKYVNEMNNRNAHLVFKKNDVTNNDKVGLLYDCSLSSSGNDTIVSCKYGIKKVEPSPEPTPNEKTGSLSRADVLNSFVSGKGYEERVANVESYLKGIGFTNINIIGVEDSTSEGTIIAVKANGELIEEFIKQVVLSADIEITVSRGSD